MSVSFGIAQHSEEDQMYVILQNWVRALHAEYTGAWNAHAHMHVQFKLTGLKRAGPL